MKHSFVCIQKQTFGSLIERMRMSIWWSDGWTHSSWRLTERITAAGNEVMGGRGWGVRARKGWGSKGWEGWWIANPLPTITDDRDDFANNYNSDRHQLASVSTHDCVLYKTGPSLPACSHYKLTILPTYDK